MVDVWEVVGTGLLGPEVLVACVAAVSIFVLSSRDTGEPSRVEDRWCFFVQPSVEDGWVGAPGLETDEAIDCSGWAMPVSEGVAICCWLLSGKGLLYRPSI